MVVVIDACQAGGGAMSLLSVATAALAAVADGGHCGQQSYRTEVMVESGRVGRRLLPTAALTGDSPGGRHLFCACVRGQTAATKAGKHGGKYSDK